jgi:hypothetical protein
MAETTNRIDKSRVKGTISLIVKGMRFLILTVITMLLLTSCGSITEEPSYSKVYISFGTQETVSTYIAEIPPVVSRIEIIIEAPDMVTIEEGFDIIDWSKDFMIFIMVPKGKDRHFIALALDQDGYIIFKGDTYADLFENDVNLVIQMKKVKPPTKLTT